MLRILNLNSLLVILLAAIILSDQFVLFDKKFDDKQLVQHSYQNTDQEGN